ncbi:MAG: nicotinate (nicotinamide) nucleotide adenylyltransferase [Oscillospiraceae bacterium]|nr:nicotinate (nicotinamide) nucleotide adenylyltransferase [Oscillospiraceae bacterium]
MGGTFNPPHNAHMMMARTALDALALDEVWLMPSGIPANKPAPGVSPARRLAMAEAAASGVERVRVSDIEAARPGVTYTVDTMRGLMSGNVGGGRVSYIILIGADLLLTLDRWNSADELLRTCAFAVFPRGSAPDGEAMAAAERLSRSHGANIRWIDAELPDISSTELRERVHAGLSIERLTPAAVQDYIDRERLYNPPPTLTREEMVGILKATLSPRRLEHSLAVERKAARLAKLHNLPEDKAALAGLLHDCAKYLPVGTMRDEAGRLGVAMDASRWNSGGLLHAIVGAAMLRERFGVTDPDILRAVRYHNTGRAGMSMLDTAVYLADKIEDTRKPYPGIEDIRKLAETDLIGAAAMSMRGSAGYVVSRGQPLHPDTPAALAYIAPPGAQSQYPPNASEGG